MKRGMLTLKKEEVEKLVEKMDITKFRGSQLYDKLDSGSKSIEDTVRILLSEEEVERILDEIGMPVSNDSILSSAFGKLLTLMQSFRQ